MNTTSRRTLRPSATAKKMDVGLSTMWALCKSNPDFPRPFKLTPRVTLFFEDEIDAYLVRCAEKSRLKPSAPPIKKKSESLPGKSKKNKQVSSGV